MVPLSLVILAVGELICPWALVWLDVPPEAMESTLQYLRIYIAGMPFLFLYNLSTGILNGLGNSKMPLVCLILSCLFNIVLDFVFILVLPWEVAGLALATLLAQMVSAAAAVWAAVRLYQSLEASSGPRFDREALGAMLKLGIPSMIQQLWPGCHGRILHCVSYQRFGNQFSDGSQQRLVRLHCPESRGKKI